MICFIFDFCISKRYSNKKCYISCYIKTLYSLSVSQPACNIQLLDESKKHMLFSNERRINRFDFKRNASKRVYICYKL